MTYEDEIALLKSQKDDLSKKIDELLGKRKGAYEAYRKGEITYSEYISAMQDYMNANSEYSKIAAGLRKFDTISQEDAQKWMKDTLSQIRDVGIGENDVLGHLTGKSPMRKYIKDAYDGYPTDWVKASCDMGPLGVRKVNRGYYNGVEICLSGNFDSDLISTAYHELGHRFEDSIIGNSAEGIKGIEKEFFKKRTEGQTATWLGTGYAKSEKAIKDDFIDQYMGKAYSDGSFELVSMGFQYAYNDPVRLAQDKDYRDWIYGILALV